jgi:hypothetical protein
MSPGHSRFDLLGPVGPHCQKPLIFGAGDEEKRFCSLDDESSCLVISIGSGNHWEFETDVFRKTNCRVETFDCTGNKQWKVPEEISSRVRFHPICLSKENSKVDGKIFMDWRSMLRFIKLSSTPTFFKMDIEVKQRFLIKV